MGYVLISPLDNVAVNLENGHKYAEKDIKKGEKIIKYGYPIGIATCDIVKGEHVHSHNMKTALAPEGKYTYTPNLPEAVKEEPIKIRAYVRKNGQIIPIHYTKKGGFRQWFSLIFFI